MFTAPSSASPSLFVPETNVLIPLLFTIIVLNFPKRMRPVSCASLDPKKLTAIREEMACAVSDVDAQKEKYPIFEEVLAVLRDGRRFNEAIHQVFKLFLNPTPELKAETADFAKQITIMLDEVMKVLQRDRAPLPRSFYAKYDTLYEALIDCYYLSADLINEFVFPIVLVRQAEKYLADNYFSFAAYPFLKEFIKPYTPPVAIAKATRLASYQAAWGEKIPAIIEVIEVLELKKQIPPTTPRVGSSRNPIGRLANISAVAYYASMSPRPSVKPQLPYVTGVHSRTMTFFDLKKNDKIGTVAYLSPAP